MKRACFRFDIDTHKCIRDGVPILLEVAKKYQARFTFYVNLGRAISPRLQTLRFFEKCNRQESEEAPKFSAIEKLGTLNYLQAALLNPKICSYKNAIKSIVSEGHELGIHGGKNHDIWAHTAQNWDDTKTRNEIEWSLDALKSLLPGYKPLGFSSPGWSHPKSLDMILSSLGFKYCADSHAARIIDQGAAVKLPHPVTNILGEPGGVAIIESLLASGKSELDAVEALVEKFITSGRPAVAYEHPYFAAFKGYEVFVQSLDVLTEEFEFVTVSELLYG